MKTRAKILTTAAILLSAAVLTGCATVQNSRQDDYYKDHGTVWRIFHPRVIAGRPLWQKALYWIGPGHCPFCRPALNATTGFDHWPSPYYEVSATSESIKAHE